MFAEHQLISIFCEIDDFCKELEKNISQPLLTGPIKSKRGPHCRMSMSEIMTIQIAFQMIGYRNFKTFYTGYVAQYWQKLLPKSNLLAKQESIILTPAVCLSVI